MFMVTEKLLDSKKMSAIEFHAPLFLIIKMYNTFTVLYVQHPIQQLKENDILYNTVLDDKTNSYSVLTL